MKLVAKSNLYIKIRHLWQLKMVNFLHGCLICTVPLKYPPTFHKNVHGVFQNPDGGQENQDREDEGADWVDDDQVGVEVDDEGSNENAQTLDEVADDVDKGRPDVDVFPLFRLRRSGLILGVVGAAFVAVAVAGI